MSHPKLTKYQKEAVVLLSLGTFLEYFDLMLYLHLAVFFNDLFFPPTEPWIAKLLVAATFSITYVTRPIGGFIIGWIGDHIGRKTTIIITTFIMAFSCIVMANIGTYAEIGITATIAMLLCRTLQGFSSMGEIVGAQLYISEILKQPYKYVYTGIVDIASWIGGLIALAIGALAISVQLNWRMAFWVGAVIALVGMFARTRLRETPEFVDYRRRMKIKAELNKQDPEIIKRLKIYQDKMDKKVIVSYFLIRLVVGSCFYITYGYMSEFMKDSLGMTAAEIVNQNTIISIVTLVAMVVALCFVRKYHPIKIVKVTIFFFLICLPFIPWWLSNVSGTISLTALQFVMFSFAIYVVGMEVVCFRYFPIATRFTLIATTFGVASAIGQVVITFGLIPLMEHLGYYGLWVIYVPVAIGFLYGVNYIEKLEKKRGSYYKYPEEEKLDIPIDTAMEQSGFSYNLGEEYKNYNTYCKYSQKLLNRIEDLNQRAKKKVNIELIKKAIIFAKKWHGLDKRNTGEPFYSHPLAVADIVLDYYFKTDVIVAAILHDVVEDTDCTIELIEQEFNPRIAQMVDRLTKIQKRDDKIVKLSLDETVDNLHKMQDNEVLLIKQLDRLHNMHTISGMKKEKQRRAAIETMNILIPSIADTVEKLDISDKLKLEDELYNLSSPYLKDEDEDQNEDEDDKAPRQK
ncbi:MFS transporter [Candidatus Bandiella euplotis]|uniref:MFS transporter n=1 Tax=Candidatus Bandiella euplotis TaxID=1664265 RepID=A0ABZ0UP54_9RICK|nr:MFS transporter [Candidatus Bandiella woodruffii]WPX97337.1 MFS transporter [Candidatus Bandiella woodruffii]